MVTVKKSGDGEYYITRGKAKSGGKTSEYNWFPVRFAGTEKSHCGAVKFKCQCLPMPQEFIGKRVRFKVCIVGEENDK